MTGTRLQGLIAATYSPLNHAGEVCLDNVPAMMERLLEDGVSGVYVCGSTGEGMSLTREERMQITEAWIEAADKRVPVIVQVGHNAIAEAALLAEHAQKSGADIVSATCPSYFKIGDVDTLIECMAPIAAAAPDLPFYYYHIPGLTGNQLVMADFLRNGADRMPNLAGLKYTDTRLNEFQDCVNLQGARFDVVWGCDEMLLGALATGAEAAIGSTYNIAAPLYRRIISAFQDGSIEEARQLQSFAVRMIRVIYRRPFHSSMKVILREMGIDLGRCRLPQQPLTEVQEQSLLADLTSIGFFQWGR